MHAEEYANLERVERDHWYYLGKRELVREWLCRVRPPRRDDALLDCGAGTGRFAEGMQDLCRVLVLDNHEESLARLRQRFRPDQVLALTADRIPLPAASVEYVTALDVLEHVPDDVQVVAELARVLKPGGVAVVTVPVGMELWSDWDVVLQHHRRYRLRQLKALFSGPEWEIVYLNHTNVLVYPVVWCIRRWRALRLALGWRPTGRRSEDRVPPAWLNGLLRRLFVGMARGRARYPIGVSLLLVATRR